MKEMRKEVRRKCVWNEEEVRMENQLRLIIIYHKLIISTYLNNQPLILMKASRYSNVNNGTGSSRKNSFINPATSLAKSVDQSNSIVLKFLSNSSLKD